MFQGISRMFQGNFRKILRKFPETFKEVLKKFHRSFTEVFKKFHSKFNGSFKGVSRLFSRVYQQGLNVVCSKIDEKFEGNFSVFNGFSRVFGGNFKEEVSTVLFRQCFKKVGRVFKVY